MLQQRLLCGDLSPCSARCRGRLAAVGQRRRLGWQVIAVGGHGQCLRHQSGGRQSQAGVLAQGGLQLLQKIVGGKICLAGLCLVGFVLGARGSLFGHRQRFGIRGECGERVVAHGSGDGALVDQLRQGHGISKGSLAVPLQRRGPFLGEAREGDATVGRSGLSRGLDQLGLYHAGIPDDNPVWWPHGQQAGAAS
ncbi:hypothetical protein D3C78_1001920 [compost metagenome]